jgi:undecaprenyl-diphosphatase
MVAIWVLIVAVVSAVAASALSIARHPAVDLIDPAPEERWLVARLAHHPRLAAYARRRIDRTTAGGLMLTLAFAVVFGAAALVGAVLDMVNSSEGLATWDAAVSRWGSEHATSTAVDVLKFLTNFGSTSVLAPVLAAVGIFDYIRHRRRDVLLFLLVVGLGEMLINNGLKLVIDRERPSVLHLTSAGGSSFPSGHSAAAAACWAAVALVLTRYASRLARALAAGGAVLVAMAVATSRALLGVHWLTDIIAGLIVGWGWFTLVAIVFGGRLQRLGEPAERVPVASDDGREDLDADLVHARRARSHETTN